MKVLGVDPGGTTGVCLLTVEDDAPSKVTRMEEVEGGNKGLIDWFLQFNVRALGIDVLVCESFNLDGRTPKPDLTPVEVKGALELLHELFGFPTYEQKDGWELVFQTNTQGKHLMTNDVLKRAGYYPKRGTVGGGHAVDALRHALTYAVKQLNHRPTINKLWPKD